MKLLGLDRYCKAKCLIILSVLWIHIEFTNQSFQSSNLYYNSYDGEIPEFIKENTDSIWKNFEKQPEVGVQESQEVSFLEHGSRMRTPTSGVVYDHYDEDFPGLTEMKTASESSEKTFQPSLSPTDGERFMTDDLRLGTTTSGKIPIDRDIIPLFRIKTHRGTAFSVPELTPEQNREQDKDTNSIDTSLLSIGLQVMPTTETNTPSLQNAQTIYEHLYKHESTRSGQNTEVPSGLDNDIDDPDDIVLHLVPCEERDIPCKQDNEVKTKKSTQPPLMKRFMKFLHIFK